MNKSLRECNAPLYSRPQGMLELRAGFVENMSRSAQKKLASDFAWEVKVGGVS